MSGDEIEAAVRGESGEGGVYETFLEFRRQVGGSGEGSDVVAVGLLLADVLCGVMEMLDEIHDELQEVREVLRRGDGYVVDGEDI